MPARRFRTAAFETRGRRRRMVARLGALAALGLAMAISSPALAHPGAHPPAEQTQLSYYALVIRGAIGGQGLALVPRVLIARELAAGELVNPLGLGFTARNCYWLTTPQRRPPDEATALFRDWALAEARRSEDPAFNPG